MRPPARGIEGHSRRVSPRNQQLTNTRRLPYPCQRWARCHVPGPKMIWISQYFGKGRLKCGVGESDMFGVHYEKRVTASFTKLGVFPKKTLDYLHCNERTSSLSPWFVLLILRILDRRLFYTHLIFRCRKLFQGEMRLQKFGCEVKDKISEILSSGTRPLHEERVRVHERWLHYPFILRPLQERGGR